MLLLVPKPIFHAGVIVGETAGVLNFIMENIKSIQPDINLSTQQETNVSEIVYYNGSKEYVSLPIDVLMNALLDIVQIKVISVPAVKAASKGFTALLNNLEVVEPIVSIKK